MTTNPNDLLCGPMKATISEHKNGYEITSGGLTNRELFAAMAPESVTIQSMTLGESENIFGYGQWSVEKQAAYFAVKYADALIIELNKKSEEK